MRLSRVILPFFCLSLPACSINVDTNHKLPVDTTLGSEFASQQPRRPGEFIPKHPQSSAVFAAEPRKKVQVPELAPGPLPVAVTQIPTPCPVAPVSAHKPSAEPPVIDPPLVAALRAYMEGRPDVAVERLKGLEKANQELLLQIIPLAVRAAQSDLSKASPQEIGVLVGQLENAAATLSPRASLFIDHANFCRSARGFGRYEPIPDQTLKAGSTGDLYLEVRNAPSEPTVVSEGEFFQTRLDFTLHVEDEQGRPVDLLDHDRRRVPRLKESKRDLTRSPIHDYYVLYRFPVPVTPGRYKATIEVLDPLSGRAVSRTISFRTI